VECLPGAPDAVAFGTIMLKIHTVTTPNGKVVERWWNPGWSEAHYLLIEGVVWALDRMVRHGIMFSEDGALVKAHRAIPFSDTSIRTRVPHSIGPSAERPRTTDWESRCSSTGGESVR
jgi:hypothetical protein